MRERLRRLLLGPPRDLHDPQTFRRASVAAFLAWIALGGDALGSCVYGTDALARAAGDGRVVLAVVGLLTLLTLALLAVSYTRVVARFPHGGGGYTAARRVLGEPAALVSGAALVLDAALIVAVSVVACVDAAADLAPASLRSYKLPLEVTLIAMLIAMNLRGLRESALLLAPIFTFFLLSHLIVLGVDLGPRAGELPAALRGAAEGVRSLGAELGAAGAAALVLRVYAASGSIYTGLEAISNGVPMLRGPRVATARRTMILLAGAPGVLVALLLVAYVAHDVEPRSGVTMNATLFQVVTRDWAVGGRAVGPAVTTALLASEALLLVVAAQTGLSDGPRVLGALAVDRFAPQRLSRINARLAPAAGVLAIGGLALLATLWARGDLSLLLVPFVVSVFVTFTISQAAMLEDALGRGEGGRRSLPAAALHGVTLLLCAVVLVTTVIERLADGGGVALAAIGVAVGLSAAIRARYRAMGRAVEALEAPLAAASSVGPPPSGGAAIAPDAPVAVVLVGEQGGLGRVALQWVASALPGRFAGVLLASVVAIDTEAAHSEEEVARREAERHGELERLAEAARGLGFATEIVVRRGTDVVAGATALVLDLVRDRGARSVAVGCEAIFGRSVLDLALREELVLDIQARLERVGVPMIVIPVRLAALR